MIACIRQRHFALALLDLILNHYHNLKIYLPSSISQQQVRQTSPEHAPQQALGAAIPKQNELPGQ
jgi:hypothetical protein